MISYLPPFERPATLKYGASRGTSLLTERSLRTLKKGALSTHTLELI
jgi:hypothetical protein